MGFFNKKEKKLHDSKQNKDSPFLKKDKKTKVEDNKTKVFLKKDNDISEKKPLDLEEETQVLDEKEEKKPFSAKKKKTLITPDMKNKPVYLEDTGEKLGIVFDTIYDKDKNIVGYKIKDGKSEAILSFPVNQFDLTNEGLIFVPGWYTNALKIIEKLEFKDRISPEITALLSDDTVTNEELYDIFVKHDDEMVEYIDDAKSLHDMINSRLKVLEKQRIALKDDLMDLTEKRLIKDIDRREFSEDVMKHRRKVNILDLNINKCKELIKRLDNTSFGIIGKSSLVDDSKRLRDAHPPKLEKNLFENFLNQSEKKVAIAPNVQAKNRDEYKDRYLQLKNQYEQLEEDYHELKVAIDKLLSKSDL
jgi:hypothetical protein